MEVLNVKYTYQNTWNALFLFMLIFFQTGMANSGTVFEQINDKAVAQCTQNCLNDKLPLPLDNYSISEQLTSTQDAHCDHCEHCFSCHPYLDNQLPNDYSPIKITHSYLYQLVIPKTSAKTPYRPPIA